LKTIALLLAATLAACASSRGDDSAREWQRAQCNGVVDSDARERCLKRVEQDYGWRKGDEQAPKKP
jgi:hypothetical protein